jgi:hypothetical protein
VSKIRAFLSHRLTFSSSNECGICFMDINPPPVIRVTRVRPSSEKVQFGKNAFSGFVFGPTLPSKFPAVSHNRNAATAELGEDILPVPNVCA